MTGGRTARARAREDIAQEIAAEARRQLREQGPHSLSLRSVARALGFASSALYRYFPSRDELLTALIVQALDALGDAVEAADQGLGDGATRRARWTTACGAFRAWAKTNPAEYALIYGSPVPGYQAPRTTVAPAMRLPRLLAAIAADAPDAFATPRLRDQIAVVARELGSPIAPGAMVTVTTAWAQLIGLVSAELFGQFTGPLAPADDLYAAAVEAQADALGFAG
ncbi:TetR/AcrR family transcriptional regulator [Actinokineospora guangxiensis]|uniref:TetR/AcrR family transcriptional regulator n=1 Tax=Actinokineospora guangxiensis TaxID=1490288 RepID=A0ABW0EN86_9PSEU